MDCQDWETVKVGVKSRPVTTTRPAHTAGTKAKRALEDDDAPRAAPRSLSAASRAEIVRIRTTEPKKSQAELNTLCSFPTNTIRNIESGHLTPSPTQLNVLNRVLRTNLRFA